MPSVFMPIEGPYSNHIGGGMTHPITGAVYFLVTYRKNSAGPYILQVWEDPIPHGDPHLIREWITGTEAAGPGPWGYGSCTWMPDGSLYVAAPGGVDGNQVKPSIHIERNVFSPIPMPLGNDIPNSGGIILFPAPLTNPAWEGRQMPMDSGVLVDIPSVFGAPVASSYVLRFVAQSSIADVRVRAGSQASPHFLTVNTQLPNVQIHAQGWAPGPSAWISTAKGAAQIWLQIIGYS